MTMAGPSPRCGNSLFGLSIVSMYFFKSMSRNSNTRYSFESLWMMSRSLEIDISEDPLDHIDSLMSRPWLTPWPRHGSDSLDNIVILAQFLQQTNLANTGTRNPFILCLQPNLFQRDQITRTLITRFVDDSVRSYPETSAVTSTFTLT